MEQRRRIELRKDDVLVVNGYELDAGALESILDPEARVLWAFVKNETGDVRPVAFNETHCIWLQDSDLVRADAEV
jgi:hypothetical protein